MSGTGREAGTPAPDVRREAREWFVRAQHTDTPAFRAELATWLAASEDHRRAYQRTAATHAQAAILKQSARFGTDRGEALDGGAPADDRFAGNVVPLRAKPARPARPAWPIRSLVAAAAAAVILVAFGLARDPIGLLIGSSSVSGDAQAAMMTRHGQIRTFRLADGSIVTLDSDTRLLVTLTNTARQLNLVRGRARFVVASDTRPFSIAAGSGAIDAGRATLDLSYQPGGRAALHVIKGRATVHAEPHVQVESDPHTVAAGQQFAYRSAPYMPVSDPAGAGALDDAEWPSGWVEARSIRVAALLGQANRYADVPIILSDRATGQVAVTGRFNVADTNAFVRRLAELLGLEVKRAPDAIYLHRK
ncbi:MAG: FecR family protein [Sphingomonas sp.]